MTQSIKAAKEAVGGELCKASKMPGYGWAIPAQLCKRGSKLAKIPGSVCHGCYALKGRFGFDAVKNAAQRRLDAFNDCAYTWEEGMIALIEKRKMAEFRWFVSGDLQSNDMLWSIYKVACLTPNCSHWLPTRERGIVRDYIGSGGIIPKNLNIRISADMMDGQPSYLTDHPQVSYSEVTTGDDWNCPAYTAKHGGKCLDCRACWDPTVRTVVYKAH